MSTPEMLAKIKQEAQSNKAAEAILIDWATYRERARHQVTVSGLAQRMKDKHSLEFPKADYSRFLKLLGTLGFGKVDMDKRGEVRALKEVKVTLQSIGEAVYENGSNIETYKRRNRYSQLMPAKAPEAPKVVVAAPVKQEAASASTPTVILTFIINGKALNVPVPKGFTRDEISQLIARFEEGSV